MQGSHEGLLQKDETDTGVQPKCKKQNEKDQLLGCLSASIFLHGNQMEQKGAFKPGQENKGNYEKE